MDVKVGRSLVKIWIMALVLLRHLIFVSSCISRSRITPSATLIQNRNQPPKKSLQLYNLPRTATKLSAQVMLFSKISNLNDFTFLVTICLLNNMKKLVGSYHFTSFQSQQKFARSTIRKIIAYPTPPVRVRRKNYFIGFARFI